MATFKYVVMNRKMDGTYNVKIQVIHKRVRRIIPTNIFVTQKEITRGGKIKNQQYVDWLENTVAEYRKRCNLMAVDSMTADDIVKELTRKEVKPELDLFKFGEKLIEKIEKEGRENTARSYSIMLNSFERFIGERRFAMMDLTQKMVRDWAEWMTKNFDRTKGKDGSGCRFVYMAIMRALFNRAREEYNDEQAGRMVLPYNPFIGVRLKCVVSPKPRALTVDEIRRISRVPYKKWGGKGMNHCRMNLAKDIFLLSFCLAGMNLVDIFHCSEYDGECITYHRHKTMARRMDRAEMVVRVPDVAKRLLERWRDDTGERVFNFYRLYSTNRSLHLSVMYGLTELGRVTGIEALQFYSARHSWATIAVNDVEVDKYTVHMGLNHADPVMRVTDRYIKKDWSIVHRANEKVMEYVFGKNAVL